MLIKFSLALQHSAHHRILALQSLHLGLQLELRKRQKIISQLVEARLEQGISQAELARRLGVARSSINRLESGTHNPSLDMILKIASAFCAWESWASTWRVLIWR